MHSGTYCTSAPGLEVRVCEPDSGQPRQIKVEMLVTILSIQIYWLAFTVYNKLESRRVFFLDRNMERLDPISPSHQSTKYGVEKTSVRRYRRDPSLSTKEVIETSDSNINLNAGAYRQMAESRSRCLVKRTSVALRESIVTQISSYKAWSIGRRELC